MMKPKASHLTVDGLKIEVIRKDIKHLHLRIYPPEGRIRVSAPRRARDRHVREFVRSKMGWVHRHLAQIEQQPALPVPQYVTGETHSYWGRAHSLRIVHSPGRGRVALTGGTIEMVVPRDTSVEGREHLLTEWYRARLKEAMPELVAEWERFVGVDVVEWRVRRMRTRWGSCNPEARRIWVNLELVKRPRRCLDYVIVHEMVHLLERRHNARFYELLDRFYPNWSAVRAELRLPLGS